MAQTDQALKRRLADVIGAHCDEIVESWLRIVCADERTSGVPLTELRDALPDYLTALRRELEADNVTFEESGGSAWREVAREHALTRVALGFDIGQLVHEFIVLRRVLHDVAEREGVFDAGPTELIVELVEAAIAVAVQSYVDARDYQARRAQAANIAFVTHELRNPLNAAMLATEHIESAVAGKAKGVHTILARNLARLRDLVDSVLETAQVEAGDIHCRPSAMTVGELVDDAVSTTKNAAKSKGLEFEATFQPDLELKVDPVLTRSALQNLLDNAVKYTDHGKIELVIEPEEEAIAFHVRDTCPGISEEEITTIFEPFRRGHTHQKGSGLGLAIVRRAVTLQGGHVGAESADEGGCHFWITMPKEVCEEDERGQRGERGDSG